MNTLFALTMSSIQLEPFGEESVIAFDKWIEKFQDYVDAIGRNWGEAEKVARLKLALVDIPRRLFKEIPPAQLITFDNAIKTLREKLDSPQKRELAKRTLSVCRQKEGETVAQFLMRLRPLVEIVNSSLTDAQQKEKVCEELLERLRPNIGFLIKLVGLSKTKNLDMVVSQAEELEALLEMENNKNLLSNIPHSIQVLDTNQQQHSQQQNYSNNHHSDRQNSINEEEDEESDDDYVDDQQDCRRNDNACSNNPTERWPRGSRQNLHDRPQCEYCNKFGHFAYECWHRPNQPQQSSGIISTNKVNETQRSIQIDRDVLIQALAQLVLQQPNSSSRT